MRGLTAPQVRPYRSGLSPRDRHPLHTAVIATVALVCWAVVVQWDVALVPAGALFDAGPIVHQPLVMLLGLPLVWEFGRVTLHLRRPFQVTGSRRDAVTLAVLLSFELTIIGWVFVVLLTAPGTLSVSGGVQLAAAMSFGFTLSITGAIVCWRALRRLRPSL